MRKTRRILAMMIAGTMLLIMLGACSSPAMDDGAIILAPAETDISEPDGVALDRGNLDNEAVIEDPALIFILIRNRGDLSYWDSIAAGGDRAAVELADRAIVRVIETTEDTIANLTAMYEAAEAGADLILSGADFRDGFIEVAREFPHIAMVMIEEPLQDEADNIYAFSFRVSEASFLAGIAAADRAAQDNSDTIGFIGGRDETIVIQEFFAGYIQGARWVNPDINIVYNYVGGWRDPETALIQAEAQFNDAGAAVIFAAAGGSGNGVHTAAANNNKFVIGVDSDQSLMYIEQPDIQSTFVTSVLKRIDNAVFYTVKRFLDTKQLPFGEREILGLEEGAVGLAQNELFESFVTAEGRNLIQQAFDGIISGEIEVWSALGREQSEIQAKLNELLYG